jgi:hypothetical protein
VRAGAVEPCHRGSQRTISRILTRRGLPPLASCDPVTGVLIRATRSTAVRYERQRPGELIHVDVKKLCESYQQLVWDWLAGWYWPSASWL